MKKKQQLQKIKSAIKTLQTFFVVIVAIHLQKKNHHELFCISNKFENKTQQKNHEFI